MAEETTPISPNSPDFYSTPHSWFAYVVDGEVAWIHVLPDAIEHFHAVLSSDPKVVKVPTPKVGEVSIGWSYDNGVFVKPTN
jgi:hypothetical protein